MTTKEVADKLVQLCSQGKFEEAMEAFYSPDIVSMEAGAPPGQSRESKGLAAVKAKGEWWAANHEVHSTKVEGPLVAGSHFAVTFKLDVTFKPQAGASRWKRSLFTKWPTAKSFTKSFSTICNPRGNSPAGGWESAMRQTPQTSTLPL